MNHEQFVCNCQRVGCQFCDGGLFTCTKCGSAEGATTSHCPGVRMTTSQIDYVYAGQMDYCHGEWIPFASPYSPAFYRRHPMEQNRFTFKRPIPLVGRGKSIYWPKDVEKAEVRMERIDGEWKLIFGKLAFSTDYEL